MPGRRAKQTLDNVPDANPSIGIDLEKLKRCPRCKKEKSYDLFHKLWCSKDGYDYYCRECTREKQKESHLRNYEKSKKRSNDWKKENRDKVNEYSTDVCLCALKDGWCTVLFNAFLCNKAATMTVSGGNTEELYTIEDGRLKMAQALVDLHPDVCSISQKFGRWQHHVNYLPFKQNKLIRNPDIIIKKGVDNYGMVLVDVANSLN